MRILMINQILHTAENGVIPQRNTIKDTMIYSMCLGFLKNGHIVTLLAAEEYRPTDIENYPFEIKFFKSVLKKLFPPSIFPFSFELCEFIKENKNRYDLVVSSETFAFGTLFASIYCPKKTIVWQELTDHQKKFHHIPSKLWHWFIAPIFVSRVVKVIPRSKPAYDFISRYVRNATPTIVDHGIDAEQFLISEKKKRQIISSSQLIARKNVEGIIDTFSRLHQMENYADIELIIAGKGSEEQALKDKVVLLGLTEAVIFVGYLDHKTLNQYIRESMAFLVNTRQDLNMVSIPESIVSGTPILTNLVPASAGYISKNNLGIVKDNWRESELKKIIDTYNEFSKNCRKYRNKLTNVYSAKSIIDIYEQNK
jgi:1,2-diacylglycerol 3-alpha-glucosyltransferase